MNFREHTPLSGGQVDDTPFGGGAGMVLRVDVMDSALRAHYGIDPVRAARAAPGDRAGPGGRLLDDRLASELAAEPALTLLCGRYEGFDERIVEHFAERGRSRSDATCSPAASWRRWSCATRCCASCPARSGTSSRRVEESFSAALEGDPEYPHYTRPAEYRGWRVPEVLLSGHHERIDAWRRERSRERGGEKAAGAQP